MNNTPPHVRELRPILGQRVKALEQAWLIGDRDDRHEIDVVLELLRRQATDDRSVLLQPPTGTEADGPIRLGRIRHGRRELGWLGITERELTQHMAVTGRSGSGKSTLSLRVLLRLMERGIPWAVFDFKRSARALRGIEGGNGVHVACLGRDVGATLSFNILAPPPGVPIDTHQRQLAELIADCWYAGDGVISVLERAMTQCYTAAAPALPTIADVKRTVDELPAKSREILWKTSAQRILTQMTTGQLGRIFTATPNADALEHLLSGHTVIELDGLATADANFVTQHLVRWLTQALLAQTARESLRFVCMIEEAHHLLAKREGARETVLETCLREGREIGLGIILADQSISAVSPTALANCFTTVCMNVRQRADVTAAAGSLLLGDDQREMLGTLPVGEAVVRLSDRWPWPVHIAVPALDLPKGRITDMDLRLAFLAGPYCLYSDATPTSDCDGDSAMSASSGPNSHPHGQRTVITVLPRPDKDAPRTDSTAIDATSPPHVSTTPRPPPLDPDRQTKVQSGEDPLESDGELRLLLEHVARQPLVGIAQRFDELGLSRRKGDALKRGLVDLGLVTPVDIPIPTGKTVLLAITADGRHWLQQHRIPMAPVNGSLPHAWWQNRVAALFRQSGWTVETECPIGGHAFDIRATKGSQTAVVEVETGRSDWLGNLSSLERIRADRRAVLWIDPASLLRVRSTLPHSVELLQPAHVERWVRSL